MCVSNIFLAVLEKMETKSGNPFDSVSVSTKMDYGWKKNQNLSETPNMVNSFHLSVILMKPNSHDAHLTLVVSAHFWISC